MIGANFKFQKLVFISLLATVSFWVLPRSVRTATADIQITEIMYDAAGADTDHEWVELKNTGSEPVEIVGGAGAGGWRFFDGGNHTLATSTVLGAGQFLVLVQDETKFLADHPGFPGKIIRAAFSLGNTTSTLALRIGSDGARWSELAYDKNWGAAGNSKTLEKKNPTGDNSAANWQESFTAGGTPGAENSQSPPENPPPIGDPPPPGVGAPANPTGESGDVKILINEFLSDPNQNEKEWVELYNAGGRAVDLTGWFIEEGSEEETRLAGTIASRDYFLVESPKGNLNNSGDIIQLFDYNGGLRARVSYGGWNDGNQFDNAPAAYDGKSVGRLIGNDTSNNKMDFAPTLRPTPRAANLFGVISSETNPFAQSYSSYSSASILLNEILPNPKGSDQEKEFIELKNISTEPSSLAGWKLMNQSGSSHTWPAATQIAAGGFLVVSRKDSRLALKNTGGEKLELYDAAGHLVDKLVYEDEANDDFSYNRLSPTSTVWLWSSALTPGRENIINTPNLAPTIFLVLPNAIFAGEEAVFDASDTFDPDDDELKFSWELEGGTKAEGDNFIYVFEKSGTYDLRLKVTDNRGNQTDKKVAVKVTDNGESKVEKSILPKADPPQAEKSKVIGRVGLDQIKNLSAGDFVVVRGAVSVLPGIFSSQNFYIFDAEAQAGIAVYSFKKDWPELKIGDEVEVAGELGNYQNSLRLKTKSKENIKVLSSGPPPEPLKFVPADLDEDNLAALAEIEGEVIESGSGYFYLANDDGEIKIQLKSNIKWKKGLVGENDMVSVLGVLGRSKGELVLWPRGLDDIKVLDAAPAPSASVGAKTALKYGGVAAGGILSLLTGFLARGKSAFVRTLAMGMVSRAAFWKKEEKWIEKK